MVPIHPKEILLKKYLINMGWENIADAIKRKIEKFKAKNGSLTVSQLAGMVKSHFAELKVNDYFEDEFDGVSDEVLAGWLEKIQIRLRSVIITTIGEDTIISDGNDYKRWLTTDRISGDNWHYWKRYEEYLRKLERPDDVIKNTANSTKEIIERLGDPKDNISELQKGLVLGSVQSGKTANFNGVLNRAIDVQYDVIIVFSGIMDDLRIQTQRRINKDVIGLGEDDGRINQPLGVGKIDSFESSDVYQITSITTTTTDFKKSSLDAHAELANQRILVCKKNVAVLANLIYWFKSSMGEGQKRLSKSLLVIDDEADNASLNNLGSKGIDYASKVNGHIRAMLNLFSRKSYLGYTATPFANILQDQNASNETDGIWTIPFKYRGESSEMKCTLAPSLFPDKFIYKLARPSDYLGPDRFFSSGSETEEQIKIPLIDIIPDNEDEITNINGAEYELRKSLIDAVDCFILSIALRESRNAVLQVMPGYSIHHSMLIHTSRLIKEQNKTMQGVKEYYKSLKSDIGQDALNDPTGIYGRLKLQWNKFFYFQVSNMTSFLPSDYNAHGLIDKSWEEISANLPHAIKGIDVLAINSDTGDKLNYPENVAQKYIAIGGNRLSRGFTLEGLTINYFLRDTTYYDSLLQMGRWFGYRPGYIDACRLFIDYETENRYNFVTRALCELEDQIESMELQRKSPKEFELRIRKHPDVLKITRASILKNAKEVSLSYANQVQQTTVFQLEKSRLENAWSSFLKLFSELKSGFSEDGGFIILSADLETLDRFLNLPNSFTGDVIWSSIREYIRLCNQTGKLTDFKIAIKSGGSKIS
jgi:hypothetical protein